MKNFTRFLMVLVILTAGITSKALADDPKYYKSEMTITKDKLGLVVSLKEKYTDVAVMNAIVKFELRASGLQTQFGQFETNREGSCTLNVFSDTPSLVVGVKAYPPLPPGDTKQAEVIVGLAFFENGQFIKLAPGKRF